MGNKNDERRCLDITMQLKAYPELQGEIDSDCESPDFLINGKVGLEHFLVDVIQERKESICRKQYRKVNDRIACYNASPGKKQMDIESGKALEFVMEIIVAQMCGVMGFKYQTFINNFKRVYEKHWEKINKYKNQCDILGFLIEIPYPRECTERGLTITDGLRTRKQRIGRGLPITNDIINCLKKHDGVDFVIITFIPINDDGDRKKCSTIKIDTDDIEGSIRRQGVLVCDKFNFVYL